MSNELIEVSLHHVFEVYKDLEEHRDRTSAQYIVFKGGLSKAGHKTLLYKGCLITRCSPFMSD